MNNPLVEAWMVKCGFIWMENQTADGGLWLKKPSLEDTGSIITKGQAAFFYNESIKARIDELLGMNSYISSLGIGGKGEYQEGFRESINQVESVLQNVVAELQAQLIQDKEN